MRFTLLVVVLAAGCGRTELAALDRALGGDANDTGDDDAVPTIFDGFGAPVTVSNNTAITYGGVLIGTRYFTVRNVQGQGQGVDSELSFYDLASSVSTVSDYYSQGSGYQCTLAHLPIVFGDALYYALLCYDFMSGPYWLVRRSGDGGTTWTAAAGSAPEHAFPSDLFASGTSLYVTAVGADFANSGGFISRSTDGFAFTRVDGPLSSEQPTSVNRFGNELIVEGFSFDSATGFSTWTERSSTDEGASWSETARWFPSEVGQFNRAVSSFVLDGVAGRFVVGTMSVTATSRSTRIVHVTDPSVEPEVVDEVAVADASVDPEATIIYSDGSALVFLNPASALATGPELASIRGSKDGSTWTELLHNDGTIRAITGPVLMSNGEILATVARESGGDVVWSIARLPIVYR